MELKVDDITLCKVKKIEGTTVFLDIEGDGIGSMVLSEVSAGRIRNLRDYVSPGRVVVCKVLKVSGNHVELSLRRVTARERDEVLDRNKKERTLKSILKAVVKNPEKVVEEIKKTHELVEFLDSARENPQLFEKFMSKDEAKKVSQRLFEKEGREKFVERKINLKSYGDNGVEDIREILGIGGADVRYLGSSNFSVKVSGRDFKEAEGRMDEVLKEIEKRAKEKKAELEMKREK